VDTDVTLVKIGSQTSIKIELDSDDSDRFLVNLDHVTVVSNDNKDFVLSLKQNKLKPKPKFSTKLLG
jgi:hypothetical protein